MLLLKLPKGVTKRMTSETVNNGKETSKDCAAVNKSLLV